MQGLEAVPTLVHAFEARPLPVEGTVRFLSPVQPLNMSDVVAEEAMVYFEMSMDDNLAQL